MRFLITGGAGFIGSAVVRHIIQDLHHEVINIDKLTYAGSLESNADISDITLGSSSTYLLFKFN